MTTDKERMKKAIEIIGDDYPTYEDIVTKAHSEIAQAKEEPTIEDQSEMEEYQHGSYEHMLDTFDWWQEYLAQQGPDGVLNIAIEVIKYADKLKDAKIEIKPEYQATESTCCGGSDCNG